MMNDRQKLKMFFELKYKYMHILEKDSVMDVIFKDKVTASIGGVRTESSMPIHLIKLAEDMANRYVYGDNIDEFAMCVMGVYDAHPAIIDIKSKSSRLISDQTTKNKFMQHMNSMKPELRAMLDDDIVADKYFLVKRGNIVGGFTTRYDGYMTGLFTLESGIGKRVIELRLEQAVKDSQSNKLTIFCYGEKVRELYEQLGFAVIRTSEFDKQYASKDWNYEKFGTPNLHLLTKEM